MVNWGIVGFGLHGVRRLMPGFELSKNCRVTALSRRNKARAEESARAYKIPHAFDSVEELCRCRDVDAVLVTSPNSCHLGEVLLAIKHGKPVLCEKPLAMNAAECRKMVEAGRKAKVLFGVAHVFRFTESVNRLRDEVAGGTIGKPLFARSEFSFLAGPEHPRSWLYDRSVAGGGPIADIGVHCIDTLRYVLQDEVVSVQANAAKDSYSGDVEAAAALNIEFSKGTLAVVLVSYRAEYRSDIEFIGSKLTLGAAMGLSVDDPVKLEWRQGGKVEKSETVSNHLAYAKQVDAFAAAMENKTEFLIPGEDGWQNQEILDAAYRSIESGKAEKVGLVR